MESKTQAVRAVAEIPLFHVPSSISFEGFEERTVQTTEGLYVLQVPMLFPADISRITEALRQARESYLAKLPVREIVHIIDEAVQKWLDPSYEGRRLAELLLPEITGYDREMIRLELKRFLRTFRQKELLRFLDEEFDQAAVLDEFRPRKSGGLSRAYGPELIFHVFSGNVPGLGIWSLVMGLLVKAATIGKTSSAEPLMAVLFARSLAEVDADFADAIAILPWKGGRTELEEPILAAAETIIAYGSNESVEQIRAKAPGNKRFLSYGHKVSFAMIGREALTADRFAETVHRVAEDVAVYDQQSCLSPQTILVEAGGVIDARQFAQMLGAELQRYEQKRPRAKLTDEEAIAIHGLRNRLEFAALHEERIALYASRPGTEWTVVYHGEPGFEGSPLNRSVHVFACERLEQSVDMLTTYRAYLQSAGLAVHPARLQPLAELLGAVGVNRISAVGQMTRGVPGWHHDGRYNLLDLVRWTDIEWTAEREAERYDPDVE